MQTLEPTLAEHPFLQGLAPRHLQLVRGCAFNVRFAAGQYLFYEGDQANKFYFIRQGKVAVETQSVEKGAFTLQILGAGEVLGWSWLVPPYRWHFDARALELTRAIALDGKCLRAKCDDDHDLGYELLTRLVHLMEQRLEATRLQLLDLHGSRP